MAGRVAAGEKWVLKLSPINLLPAFSLTSPYNTENGPPRASPQTPPLTVNRGRFQGVVPDPEPRMNCPWRGRKGWAASLVTPHTLVDGLVGGSGPGLPVSSVFNLYVQISAYVQTGPLQGQWGAGAQFILKLSSLPTQPTCTQHGTQIGASWENLGAAATHLPIPQSSNSVPSPSEAHGHSDASSLTFSSSLGASSPPQSVCSPIHPKSHPPPTHTHTQGRSQEKPNASGFLFLCAWVSFRGGGFVGHYEAGGGGERELTHLH